MHTEREVIVRTLRSRGDHDRALEAQCRLPQWVDLELDVGVLQQLDVEVSAIEPSGSARRTDLPAGTSVPPEPSDRATALTYPTCQHRDSALGILGAPLEAFRRLHGVAAVAVAPVDRPLPWPSRRPTPRLPSPTRSPPTSPGRLQFDVEGERVVVAQNFIGVLLGGERRRHPGRSLATQKNGEVAGVAINGDSVAFLSTRFTRCPRLVPQGGRRRGQPSPRSPTSSSTRTRPNPDASQTYGFRQAQQELQEQAPQGLQEVRLRPYKGIIDSHPYGLADNPVGGWYVADAAANAHLSRERGRCRRAPSRRCRRRRPSSPRPPPRTSGCRDASAGKSDAFEPVPTDVEVDDAGRAGRQPPARRSGGPVPRCTRRRGPGQPAHRPPHRTVGDGFAGAATNVAVDGTDVFVSELFGGKVSKIALDGTVRRRSSRAKTPAAIEWSRRAALRRRATSSTRSRRVDRDRHARARPPSRVSPAAHPGPLAPPSLRTWVCLCAPRHLRVNVPSRDLSPVEMHPSGPDLPGDMSRSGSSFRNPGSPT